MNSDFEKKVKKKKTRSIAVGTVVIGIILVLLFTLNIDKKDEKIESTGKGKDITVTVEIRCDVLSNDLSKLKREELKEYVPKDGIILPETKVKVKEGDSVFDALNIVCRDKEIHMESSYTPAYESNYIEGINHLYEFDAGNLSGWVYKVNEESPSYGCSSFKVKDKDKIVWMYTCDLGKDVGVYKVDEEEQD